MNGGASFLLDGGPTLPLSAVPPEADGRPAVLGLRPEHVLIDPDQGIPLDVAVVEPTGSETQIVGRLAGQPFVGVFRERVAARPGDVLPLRLPAASTHLFDAGEGRRLT